MSITFPAGQGQHELPKNPTVDDDDDDSPSLRAGTATKREENGGGRHTRPVSRACDGCRARYRCDGAKPTCNNCDVRDQACRWSSAKYIELLRYKVTWLVDRLAKLGHTNLPIPTELPDRYFAISTSSLAGSTPNSPAASPPFFSASISAGSSLSSASQLPNMTFYPSSFMSPVVALPNVDKTFLTVDFRPRAVSDGRAPAGVFRGAKGRHTSAEIDRLVQLGHTNLPIPTNLLNAIGTPSLAISIPDNPAASLPFLSASISSGSSPLSVDPTVAVPDPDDAAFLTVGFRPQAVTNGRPPARVSRASLSRRMTTGSTSIAQYASRACNYCRIRKLRCDGAPTCATCASRGVSCLYATRSNIPDFDVGPVNRGERAVEKRDSDKLTWFKTGTFTFFIPTPESEPSRLLRQCDQVPEEASFYKDPVSTSFRDEPPLWAPGGPIQLITRLSAENQHLRTQVAELRAMLSQSAPVMDWLQRTNNTPDRKFLATYSIGNVVTFPVLDGEPTVPVTIIACIDRNRRSATLKASAKVRGSTLVLALKHMTVSPGGQQEQISREVDVWHSVDANHPRHPRLQPLLGVLREDFDNAGDHLLASPWAENGNMLDYLRNTTTACRIALIHQVAEALDYLHTTLEIVHGDVKCENVLINGEGNAQLTDFGLSTFTWKEKNEETTATTLRVQYTTDFSAPELLTDSAFGGGRRRSKTVETDVYAYGMLVLQAFTLRRPWHHLDNDVQLIMSVTTGARPERPTPGLDAAFPGLDDALWTLCLQCWDAKPLQRPTMRTIVETISRSHPSPCYADPCAFAEASEACNVAPELSTDVCTTSPLDVADKTSAKLAATGSLKRKRCAL